VKGFFRFITFLIFVGLILLAFLFALKNTAPVTLWVGITLPEISVGVLIIAAFVAGGFIGLVLGLGIFRQLRYMIRIRQLQGQLDRTRKEAGSDNQVGKA